MKSTVLPGDGVPVRFTFKLLVVLPAAAICHKKMKGWKHNSQDFVLPDCYPQGNKWNNCKLHPTDRDGASSPGFTPKDKNVGMCRPTHHRDKGRTERTVLHAPSIKHLRLTA